MSDLSPVLWKPRDVVDVPPSATTAQEIASIAKQLSPRELRQLVQTFDAGAFDIASTFVWTRTMAGLKNQFAALGVNFIAEMLDRPDIRSDAEIHEVLTDYEAVRLAEELGMFGSTHALRLRHALETVTHFSNPPADADDEGMMPEEAISTLRTCVQTILGHEEVSVALEFVEFRRRLEAEVLPANAPEINGLASSAYFFRRTVLRVLLAGSKTASGAQLENLLANLNVLLPVLWPDLMAPDRFMVGRAYSEVHSDGQTKAASGLRSALVKVAGFDYVPENLRSRAFIEAAVRLQTAHFDWDNFQNEPSPMRALASLGSSIPMPAFAQCMTAVLLVRIGNRYGTSWNAQPDAIAVLDGITGERWTYFFDNCLPSDDALLSALQDEIVAANWCAAVGEIERAREATPVNPQVASLLHNTLAPHPDRVARTSRAMWSALRPS